MNFDHIEHYGVPGMRWGVRRDLSASGRAGRKEVRAEVKRDLKWSKELKRKDKRSVEFAVHNKMIEDRMERDRHYREEVMNQSSKNLNRAIVATGAFFTARALTRAVVRNTPLP
jgi:hypothetical protein